MAGTVDDDEYVASLLKQDAQNAKKKYELVGIDAFNPKRSKPGAPKPNTNFLRHIIRQTDSHNSALLAREAEESSARLKRMNRERIRAQKNEEVKKERKADGRLTPVLSDEEEPHSGPSKRRTDDRGRGDRHRNGHRHRERSQDSRDQRHRSRSRDHGRDKRKRDESRERSTRQSGHPESRRERDHRRRHDTERDSERDSERSRSQRKQKSTQSHKRRRSRSRSSSRSRSRSSHSTRTDKKRRYRSRSRSQSPRRPHRKNEDRKASGKSKRRSPNPHSDSDPLEAIVGPLPPHMEPSVRSRGRGAHKANSMGMDSRFSSAYDPTVDVRPPSDAEDEWGDAVESFRDRQRFKQQGADRLRAAGFTDEQVRKWEKGDVKDEEDVTWTKQAREWDRGKVVDEDGDVELKADWGRLK
ncbi:hypothetical protein HBI67_220990 [Parastagonospora nodorum]|nr:hypothetical protein HBI67_220990 [Parastagonospora nodorum]KAH6086728.1 hypothetical protein HBI66_037650 [Parastagonospora nodorum]